MRVILLCATPVAHNETAAKVCQICHFNGHTLLGVRRTSIATGALPSGMLSSNDARCQAHIGPATPLNSLRSPEDRSPLHYAMVDRLNAQMPDS
jgi:hypothetical protein